MMQTNGVCENGAEVWSDHISMMAAISSGWSFGLNGDAKSAKETISLKKLRTESGFFSGWNNNQSEWTIAENEWAFLCESAKIKKIRWEKRK